MPRMSLILFILGFGAILGGLISGVFHAFTLTEMTLNPDLAPSQWELSLTRTAHGHSSLFGFLMIFMGLTLPYSRLPPRIKKLQAWSLVGGWIAMGPLLVVRAQLGPAPSTSPLGLLMGAFITFALTGILVHLVGIALKLKN